MLVHFHFHLDGSAVYIIDKKDSAPSSKARKTNEVAKRDWGEETKEARKSCRALFSRLAVLSRVCVPQKRHFSASFPGLVIF